MTIGNIIANVSKSKDFKAQVYIGDLAEKAFNLPYIQNWEEQEVITSYYFGDWYCTDHKVGYKVYFFNDVPVAISTQLFRKATEKFEWVSNDTYNKVKAYVLTFEVTPEDDINLVDLDKELGETYKVNFYCQMYTHHKKKAIHKGLDVKIVDFKDSTLDKEINKYSRETVKIKFADASNKWVEPKELDFNYNLTENL